MTRKKLQRVVFQPQTHRAIQRGVNQLVDAIRPTLGPQPRSVAIAPFSSQQKPELLDKGGVIARRIIQLPDRDEDVGAMFLRQMLWKQQEMIGDGTATAAVLFQAVFDASLRYIAAGGNAMRLRQHLEQGQRLVLEQLNTMTLPVMGRKGLEKVARSTCYDPDLAKLMGEIFDIIGEHGQLDIQSGRRRGLEREYVEGSFWQSGLLSRHLLDENPSKEVILQNPVVLISDFEIQEPAELVPTLKAALQSGAKALILVVGKVSDKVQAFLLANNKPDKFQVIAVKTPGSTIEDQAAALNDLSVLTGGRPFFKLSGETLDNVRAGDLGAVRTGWANRINFGVRGGKGDARQLRRHIQQLRQGFQQADETQMRDKFQQRIGKLLGGSATLWIGAATELELKARKETARQTASAVRGAVMEGVLPGGGIALYHCAQTLAARQSESNSEDERAAYGILAQALQAPLRTILANAGYDPSEVIGQLEGCAHAGWYGFDLETAQVVDVVEAGILDVAAVQKTAVRNAISSAALALTIDVLIHRPRQQSAPNLNP